MIGGRVGAVGLIATGFDCGRIISVRIFTFRSSAGEYAAHIGAPSGSGPHHGQGCRLHATCATVRRVRPGGAASREAIREESTARLC